MSAVVGMWQLTLPNESFAMPPSLSAPSAPGLVVGAGSFGVTMTGPGRLTCRVHRYSGTSGSVRNPATGEPYTATVGWRPDAATFVLVPDAAVPVSLGTSGEVSTVALFLAVEGVATPGTYSFTLWSSG